MLNRLNFSGESCIQRLIIYDIAIVLLWSSVSHLEEVCGQYFQLGVWSTFLNTSKILLIYIVLHVFSHFFNCTRCSFEHNARKRIIFFRNLSDNNNFLFLFFIFGDIFLGADNVSMLPFLV